MEFRFQKKLYDAVAISKNRINIYPVVMDYSNMYKYNQYAISGLIDSEVKLDGAIKYIEDPAIENNSIMVTAKIDQWGTPLFQQYQLKYDCKYPENIKVYDKDGIIIPFTIEYGMVGSTHTPLNYNQEKLYDPFDSYTIHGQIITAPIYNALSAYADLPYTIYGTCLYSGEVEYTQTLLSSIDANVFSIYFLLKEVTDPYEEDFIYSDAGSIKLKYSGSTYTVEFNIGSTYSLTIEKSKWYRLDYYYTDTISHVDVWRLEDIPATSLMSENFTGSLLNTEDSLKVKAVYNVCFDLGFFKDSLPDPEDPLFVHRYSKTINWVSTKPTGASAYRIRLLFKDDTPATVVYDGVNENDDILQNRQEEINYQLVYKKYTNVTANDWTYTSGKIICNDTLEDEVDVGDTVYILPVVDNQVEVFYDSVDKKIHVTSGYFRENDYDGITNTIYYEIPEYEDMAFATDGQTTFRPYYIRVVRERANLISPYVIQIGRFYMYEGDYPDYVIPNTYEVYRYTDKNGVLQKWTTGVEENYITARGINIYRNGALLDNSDIINYNMYNGTITWRTKFNADDRIEITYLKKMPDFIVGYPILNPLILETEGGIGSNVAFRLYLRPSYPNYEIENPNDTQVDKLCYKFLVNGQPVGEYRSCFTNMTFNPIAISDHATSIIPIADISLITDREFEDVRERGGGITEDVKTSYDKSATFLDIGYGVNGKVLYQSMVIIKIPQSIVDNLVENYYQNDEDGAVIYVKQCIERYIGSGIFYIIVDEDYVRWKNPYPLTVKI